MKRIAVVVPAYKVENQIQDVIDKIPALVETIIVVNDCSPDATLEHVLRVNDPRVHILSHQKNEGVGGALLSGYSYALKLGAEIVVKVDGDGQMDCDYIPLLVHAIENGYADYVKGNRFLHADELRKMPVVRFMANVILTFLTKLASGYWAIFDPANGYTAINSELLVNLNPSRIRKDYFFETSMLCELRLQEAVVEDVPIPAIYSGQNSSVNLLREVFNFSFSLFTRVIRRFYVQYFLYNFSAVSAFMFFGTVLGLFGVIWSAIAWSRSATTLVPATTGTVLIGVLAIILAAQFYIQAIALDVNTTPQRRNSRLHLPGIKTPGRHPMTEYIEHKLQIGEIKVERGVS